MRHNGEQVSEDGHVIYWSNKIKQGNHLRLDEDAFVHAKSLRVTDSAYLTNAQRMIVLATTSRDLRFYNSVTGVPFQKVDMDAIVMCMVRRLLPPCAQGCDLS